MKAIGLISGTSIDGIDAVIVDIFDELEQTDNIQLHVLGFATYPYPDGVRERILEASVPGGGSVEKICHLNAYIGELFARAAIRIADETGISLQDIDVIGSHGQTIQHLPNPKDEQGIGVTSTLQIGEPSIIAERTGVTTVADFRPRDMAAGGQGAPFAPYAHYRLFRHPTKHRVIINIGGISNLTYIPPGASTDQVIAFDTGPGNMILDRLANQMTDGAMTYDLDGKLAAQGTCQRALLSWLMSHPYLERKPPKSTGREEFGEHFVARLREKSQASGIAEQDVLTTATAFTAEAILHSYAAFLPAAQCIQQNTELIFCGGGVKNHTLMTLLQKCFAPIRVSTVEKLNISSDALEAMTFALLARETLLGRPSNLPSVTGATHPVVLGKIIPGSRYEGRKAKGEG
jgi:anhydro-N-acetylmuramic acid kinase